MKYYRAPWSKEKVDILIKNWPHWGTKYISNLLNLRERQVKSKVDKLNIKMLPKKERICIKCKEGRQSIRRYGFLCRKCFLDKRKNDRENTSKPREVWISELLRTLRYRSKEPCNLTLEYLLKIWDKQTEGKREQKKGRAKLCQNLKQRPKILAAR